MYKNVLAYIKISTCTEENFQRLASRPDILDYVFNTGMLWLLFSNATHCNLIDNYRELDLHTCIYKSQWLKLSNHRLFK